MHSELSFRLMFFLDVLGAKAVIDYTGQQIAKYLLQALIGSEAFRSVYLAHPDGLKNRSVAVKLWQRLLLRSTLEQEQFVQEAEMLAQLHHPHILRLLGSCFFSDHLFPYLVMEYAPGGSLRALLGSAAPHLLPPAQALALLTQIGQALHYAHQQQIIHTQLNPLLLPSTEQVLLKALARKPENRWPSVLAFLAALSGSMTT